MTNIIKNKSETIKTTKSYMTPKEYADILGVSEFVVRSRMTGVLAEFVGEEDGKQVIYAKVFEKYPPRADGKTFDRLHRMDSSKIKSIVKWIRENKVTSPGETAKHFGINYYQAADIFRHYRDQIRGVKNAKALQRMVGEVFYPTNKKRVVVPFASAEAPSHHDGINISLSALESLLGCHVNITR